jgi:hypothetical protein
MAPTPPSSKLGNLTPGSEVTAGTHHFGNALMILAVVGFGAALFGWCGGLRWIRRLRERSKYMKVDNDLEK